MKMNTFTVNEKGINEIKEFLANHHKKYQGEIYREQLNAWVREAEFQISEGNPASIEIKSWDSISGHTEELTLSAEGLDKEEVEIDE